MTGIHGVSKAGGGLLLALAALSACGGRKSASAASPPAAKPVAQPAAPAAPVRPSASDSMTWLVADSAAKTATLTLEVTRPAGSASALINGYRTGQAQVVVPRGWTVRWNWRNADQAPHSLAVMVQREKIPLEGGRPAFSNAVTRSVTEGLAPGQTDQTTFEADEAGWYWLLCGVPSHAVDGEWLELRVDPEATTARAQPKPTR